MLRHSGVRFPDPGPLTVEYDPRPSAVREARQEVRRHLEGWGPAEPDELAELVDTAELLVSELATNALLHSAGPFRLTLTVADAILRCEVADLDHRSPRVLGVDTSGSGGHGMFLVDALAKRWGCEQDGAGKTVWFELDCG